MEESGEQCTVVFAYIVTEPPGGEGGGVDSIAIPILPIPYCKDSALFSRFFHDLKSNKVQNLLFVMMIL
jgi:hypothetical protein